MINIKLQKQLMTGKYQKEFMREKSKLALNNKLVASQNDINFEIGNHYKYT